ncbi:MAG: UvrD-helicase domain-containing protein, partial [Candidatus Delongbacteria bacterium]
MNIDFDKIFTEQNGSFKRPEVIASSLLLIKDIGQAQGIKLSMMEWLKANKKPVSFLPEIKAVHDHAREISEIGTGGEIREEDFLVLTERARVKGLFDKFKKPHYRNYKKSLLKLLNYLGLGDGKVKDINVVKDLEKNGLVPEVISGVEQYINEKGYYFKGQIFSAASAKAKETENIYYLNFYKGEYSCKEKEFFKALGAEQIEFRSEGRFFCLSDIFEGKDGVFPCAQHAEFIVSDSMLDEARKIKHFILQALSNKNSTYSLKDFTVVCSDEESFRTLNNYLYAENIPACSSYKFSGGDINTDVLRLFKAGANGDAQAVLNFFNLYIAQKPLQFKDLTELDLKTLIKKLKNGDNSDYQLKFSDNKKKSRKEKNADENLRRHFIESFLDAALSFDRMMSAKKALTIIKAKLNALKQVMRTVMKDIDTDIFAYEETVNRIFGDTERNFSDYLEYIYIIASKTNTLKLNKDQSGVRLMMMNEASPAGRVLIFSGLTEETFLKASNPVKMMSRDNYFNLYKSIYGKDPEQALYQNLRIITSGQTERAVFIVPEWGEETIPSTRLDKLFEQYPKKRSKIKVIPPGQGPEDLEADFSVSLKDRLMQKGFGKIDITETKPRPERAEFGIELKSKKIEEYLLSPSKLENFMACPASFVHDLNLAYDKIESQFPFTKGNFYHKVTEKFLNSFKGKDLLNDEEYGLTLYELQNGRSDISYSRFTEFADFYLYEIPCFKYISAFETIASKIKNSGIEKYIKKELEMQEKNDPYSYYSRVKLRTDVIKFIAWLIIELGPTPLSVTSTFATEVKFSNFEVCREPRITIKRGYIDLLYKDIKGTVKIIDIKSSAAFDKFEEEIKNYQKVQLLLYREAVSRGIRGETGVDLFAQREDIKQDSDCTILQKEYFDLIPADAKIEALYYSPVKPYRLAVEDQSYEEFLDRLKKKLGSGTKFEPDACSKCEYCPLSQSCPEYDESKFEQIPGFTPEKDALPQSMIYGALSSKKEISGEEEKKFIMFKKEKAEALVSKENIIVSAGAGAGKTEVLSSKYINLLLNTEAGSENIVCITFTKKAAGEMQKRIYSKITDIIESGYFILTDKGSDPASYRLRESQKQKLNAIKEEFYDKNLISTFHSFCNHFITEYGYFSDQLKEYDAAQDLSEDLTVRTEAVKFLKDQFDTGYRELLSLCLNEDEYKVFDTWLRSRHLIYSNDYKGGFIPDLIDLYEQMKLSGKELTEENWIEPLEKYLNNIRLKIEKEFGSYFSLRKEILGLIENEADDKLRELGQKITAYKEFSYKRAAKKYPAILDLAEELSLSDGYQIFNKKNVDISLNSEEWAVKKAVFSIIQALDDHLNEFKKQKGLIEQSDLHLHFLEMLKDKELREKFRTGFKYILVDEFQDTNWLQDKILVSLAGKDNKFFLVGDKKQSIFRFQQCDVQIFDKYSDPKKFKTLYFSDNYRSDSRIVEFYNQIFAPDVPNGYNIIREENEFSRPVRTENKFPVPVNFVNISCKKTKKESELKKNEMNRISKMCEAAFVADTISENIEAGQKYDSWAVLIRKYTHIGYITEAFRKKNIPYTLILKKDLYKLSEVKEYILILKAAAGLISA